MEWFAIFVVKTALGVTPLPNLPVYYFRSYRACADFVAEFNGNTPETKIVVNAQLMTQHREARCWSVGDQEAPQGDR